MLGSWMRILKIVAAIVAVLIDALDCDDKNPRLPLP